MEREPAVTIGALVTAVTALLALVVAYVLDLAEGSVTAALTFLAAAGPIITGKLVRGRVTPVPSVPVREPRLPSPNDF